MVIFQGQKCVMGIFPREYAYIPQSVSALAQQYIILMMT